MDDVINAAILVCVRTLHGRYSEAWGYSAEEPNVRKSETLVEIATSLKKLFALALFP
jgi:hypothetical protein